MAKSNQTPARTEPIDVAWPEAAGVLAAWQGLYHAFGARIDGYDVADDGIVIKGLTFSGDIGVQPSTIISNVNSKGRRVPLFPTIQYLNGAAPAPFANAQEMTVFGVQNFRGSVEDGSTRVPKYVRDAFSRLKAEMGISGRRGPKPRTINLKNISQLDASTLKAANVSSEDLLHLAELAREVAASQGQAEVTNA